MKNNIWQGNRNKHESKNPLIQLVLNKFHSDIHDILSTIPSSKILEVGCGEGFVTNFLASKLKNSTFESIDIEESYISYAKTHHNPPNVNFKVKNLFDLTYPKNAFDAVICLEVLEHFENPEKVVEQILKFTNKYAIFSVPNEPYFSLANILRLKYLKTLGNPPIHAKKWNTKEFKSFIGKFGEIIKFKTSTFWNVALISKF